MDKYSNFFTNEICSYYEGIGHTLSESVIQILNKSPFELTEEEKDAYKEKIMPMRDSIKKALSERLDDTNSTVNDWKMQLANASDSVIGMLASEMLAEHRIPSDDQATDNRVTASQNLLPENTYSEGHQELFSTAAATVQPHYVIPEKGKDGLNAKKKGGKAVILGITGAIFLVLTVSFLLFYFLSFKPVSDYEKSIERIKDRVLLIMDDASRKAKAFESGKTTFGEAGDQIKSIIDDVNRIKAEAQEILPPASRKEKHDGFIKSITDLEQAYTYYNQYITHYMTAQSSDRMIEIYEERLSDYQNKLLTSGYSFYEDHINDTHRKLENEKAEQEKYYDMANNGKKDYEKLLKSCRNAFRE